MREKDHDACELPAKLAEPHACFFSQRVRIAKDNRIATDVRSVEELELREEVPLELLPFRPSADAIRDDTERLSQALSGTGLHDMLIGFFAQQ